MSMVLGLCAPTLPLVASVSQHQSWSLRSRCLQTPGHLGIGTPTTPAGPRSQRHWLLPQSLKPLLPNPPMEQHSPHSSPSLTSPSLPNLEVQGQLLPYPPSPPPPTSSACPWPPLHTGLAPPIPPQSPPIPDPTIAPPFSVLSGRWQELMAS